MPNIEEENLRVNRNIFRNITAFWILGLCNNFAYVVMLSAAKDILEKDSNHTQNEHCIKDAKDIPCSSISTGAVLLADILPTLFVKISAPFILKPIPYSIRHLLVVLCQILSFVIVAFSSSVSVGLIGVVFASFGSGLGEVSYLSLSSHFHNDVVTSWASGTGGAGIIGATAFAILTDKRLIGLSPQNSLLFMLIIPAILLITFGKLLESPVTVYKVNFYEIRTYWITSEQREARLNYHYIGNDSLISPEHQESEEESPEIQDSEDEPLISPETQESEGQVDLRRPILEDSALSNAMTYDQTSTNFDANLVLELEDRIRLIKPLLKFMLPLCIVYFAEYFINQGMVEIISFPCYSGFYLSLASQYRWYQVLYQMGVFISRSSAKFIPLNASLIPLLAFLQVFNGILFFGDALYPKIPHIVIVFILVFYEGLLGGSAYVNTFNAVHKSVNQRNREFSMSFVSMSDSLGIVLAGFAAIFAHNFICTRRES